MSAPQGLDARDVQFIRSFGYSPIERIGKGAFGAVYRCQHRDGQSVAIKVLKVGQGIANDVTQSDIENERNIINTLSMSNKRHPNILRIQVETPPIKPLRAYFISDLSPIGDLFSYFQRTNAQNIKVWVPMPENQCRFVFKGVAQGLQWMHSWNVAHGDLKPHNILLFYRPAPPDPTSRVDRDFPEFNRIIAKICDFGNSKRRSASDPLGKIMHNHETCAAYFAAPESWYRLGNVPKVYDMIPADCFSLGNSMLSMLLGAFPYQAIPPLPGNRTATGQSFNRTEYQAFRHTIQKKRDHTYTKHLCRNFHHELRDVLVRLLDPNPNVRMNLTEFLAHPWIRQTSFGDRPGRRELPARTMPFQEVSVEEVSAVRPRRWPSIERGDHRGGTINLPAPPTQTLAPPPPSARRTTIPGLPTTRRSRSKSQPRFKPYISKTDQSKGDNV